MVRGAAGKGRARTAVPQGIAPSVLLQQVHNTAAWALGPSYKLPSARYLLDAAALEKRWKEGADPLGYLRFLLCAHYTTVATFVPTDVDTRIREHAWAGLRREQLGAAIAIVEEVATWDERPVSARVVTVEDARVSGHQGEWFSVMSGALGRSLALGDEPAIAQAEAWIDAELAREAAATVQAQKQGDPQQLLSLATMVAHNLGDLSRVVDTWKPELREGPVASKYHRLGFREDGPFGGVFAKMGALNNACMAVENHRFLTLRVPRALRRSRDFLVPIGPYFFEWGQTIGQSAELAIEERAEILAALLAMHVRRTEEHGCLRAIAGLAAVTPGGIDSYAKLLDPIARPMLQRGGVREAIRTPEAKFLAKFHEGVVPAKRAAKTASTR
jgi:hypothetical protein